jgi:hypothetical protein
MVHWRHSLVRTASFRNYFHPTSGSGNTLYQGSGSAGTTGTEPREGLQEERQSDRITFGTRLRPSLRNHGDGPDPRGGRDRLLLPNLRAPAPAPPAAPGPRGPPWPAERHQRRGGGGGGGGGPRRPEGSPCTPRARAARSRSTFRASTPHLATPATASTARAGLIEKQSTRPAGLPAATTEGVTH